MIAPVADFGAVRLAADKAPGTAHAISRFKTFLGDASDYLSTFITAHFAHSSPPRGCFIGYILRFRWAARRCRRPALGDLAHISISRRLFSRYVLHAARICLALSAGCFAGVFDHAVSCARCLRFADDMPELRYRGRLRLLRVRLLALYFGAAGNSSRSGAAVAAVRRASRSRHAAPD